MDKFKSESVSGEVVIGSLCPLHWEYIGVRMCMYKYDIVRVATSCESDRARYLRPLLVVCSPRTPDHRRRFRPILYPVSQKQLRRQTT